MTELTFHIPGLPVGKGRPVFIKKTGGVFTPRKTKHAEDNIRGHVLTQLPRGWKPSVKPAQVDLFFYFKRPKTSKRVHHTVKPDIDNIIKMVTDALNGFVWVDDSQVWKVTAMKAYSAVGSEHIDMVVRFE